MPFPFAVASLGKNLDDAAKPVGYLYVFNTVACVLGSLGAFSFTRLHPLIAAALLFLSRKWPGWVDSFLVAGGILVTFATP